MSLLVNGTISLRHHLKKRTGIILISSADLVNCQCKKRSVFEILDSGIELCILTALFALLKQNKYLNKYRVRRWIIEVSCTATVLFLCQFPWIN